MKASSTFFYGGGGGGTCKRISLHEFQANLFSVYVSVKCKNKRNEIPTEHSNTSSIRVEVSSLERIAMVKIQNRGHFWMEQKTLH